LGSKRSGETFEDLVTRLKLDYSQRRKLALPTSEKGSISWPTPTTMNPSDKEDLEHWEERRLRMQEKHHNGNGIGTPLGVAVRLWPTPNSRDWKGAPGKGCRERGGHQSSLPAVVEGAYLNPDWVETLMGYPVGWTSTGPLDPQNRNETGSLHVSELTSQTERDA
jgi:hypothetical protein